MFSSRTIVLTCLRTFDGGLFYQVFEDVAHEAVGIVVEIDAAEGVLHHVFHNPVGREDLRGRRDLVSFSFLAILKGGKDLVFLLRDIELIEPANQFGVAVIVSIDVCGVVEQVDEIAIDEDVVWQEQFGVAGDASETSLQDGMVVAEGGDEDLELLEDAGIIAKDFVELLSVGRLEII